MTKQLLESRIAILMAKENYSLKSNLKTYQDKLKQYFSFEYTLDEIENALNKLEDNELIEEYKREQESIVVLSQEDFELVNTLQLI